MTFALAAPPLLVLGCSAVDLSFVVHDKNNLQALADSAALAGAKQLGMTESTGVEARAGSFVDDGMSRLPDLTYHVSTTIPSDASSVTVEIKANRLSFFANMLPPGGWNFSAKATAVKLNSAPLCIISTGKDKTDPFEMKGQTQINAPDCFIHANSDIKVDSGAWLRANTVQTASLAKGNIVPTAQTGAEPMDDPFAGLNVSIPLAICNPLDLLVDVGVMTLGPGVHCGPIDVAKTATLNLLPGEHYFLKSNLKMEENSTLSGKDVVLIFDSGSKFDFKDGAVVDLEGRKSGNYAGFVIATTLKNTQNFTITSDNARKLLGTIYIPNAQLHVEGKNKVADQSAWTVVVAESIKMDGNANLVINTNYAGSGTPVPSGVGPRGGEVRLQQ
ncbi:MAG: hypothetical protein JWM33_3739 [Caulobacteraceae bacterium]|nr:hypothetical protein [Caulobacteraceae bacterium]